MFIFLQVSLIMGKNANYISWVTVILLAVDDLDLNSSAYLKSPFHFSHVSALFLQFLYAIKAQNAQK